MHVCVQGRVSLGVGSEQAQPLRESQLFLVPQRERAAPNVNIYKVRGWLDAGGMLVHCMDTRMGGSSTSLACYSFCISLPGLPELMSRA
jgi:hypothetical protein